MADTEGTSPEATSVEVETAMSDAFQRLHWSVFEEISKIRVAKDGNHPTLIGSLPFQGHPIAAEEACSPPLTELKLWIDGIYEPEEEEDREDYEIDEPLVVYRADGGIVTIGDIVEQLSAHFIANKAVILRSKACVTGTINGKYEDHPSEDYIEIPQLGPGAFISAYKKVFFAGFSGCIDTETKSISVGLWADGEWGQSAEDRYRDWGYGT